MTLSLENINKKAPYPLTQLTDMTFSFVTEQGVHYDVGFFPDEFFMRGHGFHFFIENTLGEHGSYDPKVMEVVVAVIEEFFMQDSNVMLYIYDPYDKRQASRNRLYRMWFLGYAFNHEMTLYSDSVTFEGETYYSGVLMRHDHPLHDEIIIRYQQFLKIAPQVVQFTNK